MLRSEIRGAFGEPPGQNCCTVNFEMLNQNIDVFLEYIGILHRHALQARTLVPQVWSCATIFRQSRPKARKQ